MAQRSREERLLEQLLNKTTKVDLNTDSLELTVGGKYDTGSRGLSNGDIVPVSINASGETIVALSAIDNAVLDAMVIDLAAMEVLLTAIDADTNSIKTAVEILDNAISGNEMQVDVVASLPAGANTIGGVTIAAGSAAIGTVALSATDNAVLDTIDAVLDTIKIDTEAIETATEAIQTDAAAIEVLLTSANVDHAANEVLLTAIDADTNAIKDNTAAIEVSADALIAANHTDLLAIEASADALIAANHSDLVTLAGRISNVESGVDELIAANHTDLVAIDAVLDTIDADTNAMKVDLAAIEVLSTAANVDLAALEVLSTAANVDLAAIEVDLAAIEVTQNRMVAPTSTVYLAGTKAFTGPFYAITALTDTVIDVSEGDTNIVESDDSGSMQATATNITLPAGISIYGNFAAVELDSGTAIGYAGAGVTVTVAS